MTTHQSSHLAPLSLSSAWASPPTKTGGFALFGHTLGVRRDLSPLCKSFLLCVPTTPQACRGRKHLSVQYFALVLGAQTRCYVSTGLCAAKRENSQKWMEFHRADHLCVCEAAKKMFSSSLNFQSLCKTSGMKSLCISHLFTLPGHSHISRNLDLSLCLAPSSALVHPLSLFHSASNSGCIRS